MTGAPMPAERNMTHSEQGDCDAGGESAPRDRNRQSPFGEPGGVELWLSQYEWEAAARDRVAEERDRVAAGRDSARAALAGAAAARAGAAAARHTAVDTRARSAWLRTHPVLAGVSGAESETDGTEPVDEAQGGRDREDHTADAWGVAARRRDRVIARRERAADRHDFDRLVWLAGDDLWEDLVRILLQRADRRDHLAELRDRAAEKRDRVAASRAYNVAGARCDRMASVVDRANSAQDRDAAAGDRAELIAAVRDLVRLARREQEQ